MAPFLNSYNDKVPPPSWSKEENMCFKLLLLSEEEDVVDGRK